MTLGTSHCKQPEGELEILVRARYPLIFVQTWEEERLEERLRALAGVYQQQFLTWSVTQGLVPSPTALVATPHAVLRDPLALLEHIAQHVGPAVFMLKDFHPHVADGRANLSVVRRLREMGAQLQQARQTLVMTGPRLALAIELTKDVAVLDHEPPTRDEFEALLARIADEICDQPQYRLMLDAAAREQLWRSAQGLTLREMENVLARALVVRQVLDAATAELLVQEKRQLIRKGGLLEFCEPGANFGEIGGLEALKAWLQQRQLALSPAARDFGLPAPRGVLLLGVQGCGKSLCAKAVANLWKLPLLRFDIGRLFASLLGASEENVRAALRQAEALAPVVLWIDEIDKAVVGVAGATSDGGAASRVLATLLTWLAEKTAPVFVMATSNDVRRLPPELLRKGRFDEIFFVDLPDEVERREIFARRLALRERTLEEAELATLARQSAGFSGAEIEAAIIEALFAAFSGDESLSAAMILAALMATTPLSATMREEVDALRHWAVGRARRASSPSLEYTAGQP